MYKQASRSAEKKPLLFNILQSYYQYTLHLHTWKIMYFFLYANYAF